MCDILVSFIINGPELIIQSADPGKRSHYLCTYLYVSLQTGRLNQKFCVHLLTAMKCSDPSILVTMKHAYQWRIQGFTDRGHQPIIWPNFSLKLHENERNWTEEGGGRGTPLFVFVLALNSQYQWVALRKGLLSSENCRISAPNRFKRWCSNSVRT